MCVNYKSSREKREKNDRYYKRKNVERKKGRFWKPQLTETM